MSGFVHRNDKKVVGKGMSIHYDCGAEIRWSRKPDDPESFMPPLEYSGQGFIFDENGIAIQVTVYKPHFCNADQMEVWLKNKVRIDTMKGTEEFIAPVTNDMLKDARDKEKKKLIKYALRVPCPTCEAPEKVMCVHVLNGTPVKAPHIERIKAAKRAEI